APILESRRSPRTCWSERSDVEAPGRTRDDARPVGPGHGDRQTKQTSLGISQAGRGPRWRFLAAGSMPPAWTQLCLAASNQIDDLATLGLISQERQAAPQRGFGSGVSVLPQEKLAEGTGGRGQLGIPARRPPQGP